MSECYCTVIDGKKYLCERCVEEQRERDRGPIKHRDKLLAEIAKGLDWLERGTSFGRCPLHAIEVSLLRDGEVVLSTSLVTVLDYLANGTYFNESSDWSEADVANVRTI